MIHCLWVADHSAPMGSNINICYNPSVAYKRIEDRRAASERHYEANKQRYLERNTKYRATISSFVHNIKEATPCADCSVKYPYYVMDFDHINAKDKVHDINFLSSTGRIGALKKEIEKCEVVCSNCHRQRSHNRWMAQARTLSSAD